MVSGTNYAVKYFIKLNQNIDYYNDLLPICTQVRQMIYPFDNTNAEYKNDNNITNITVFACCDSRFLNKKEYNNYTKAVYEFEYNYRNKKPTDIDKKYLDVFFYSQYIKFKNIPVLSQSEYEELSSRFNYLESNTKSADNDNSVVVAGLFENPYIREEYFELKKKLKIYELMKNEEYFEEIKRIEHDLTNIMLSEAENNLIKNVLEHPTISDKIEYHGFQLYKYDY